MLKKYARVVIVSLIFTFISRDAFATGMVLGKPMEKLIKTSDFGYRVHPVTNDVRFHSGTDYGNQTGTNIMAVLDGEVVFAGEKGGYGKLVIIKHTDDVESYYAHTSKILVNVGDNVKKGQIIAEVGSTGVATGPHLHLEIRIKNTPQNPENYIGKELKLDNYKSSEDIKEEMNELKEGLVEDKEYIEDVEEVIDEQTIKDIEDIKDIENIEGVEFHLEHITEIKTDTTSNTSNYYTTTNNIDGVPFIFEDIDNNYVEGHYFHFE